MVSIFLRSLLFNMLFYPIFVFWAMVALPTLAMPRTALLRVANWWAQSNILLMRVICNIKVEFRGIEKIPDGAADRRRQASVDVGDHFAAAASSMRRSSCSSAS